MSIVSYCRTPPRIASPDDTLRDAAQRMREARVGLLVVTEGERVTGMLSDRDIAVCAARPGFDASAARVSDAMRPDAVEIDAGEPLERGFAIMAEHRVRRLPVTEEGRLKGLVSADDLALLLAREITGLGEVLVVQLGSGASRGPGRGPGARAAERYASEVVALKEQASVREAAGQMRDRAVGCVVVIDDQGSATGIATDRDIALRAVAAGLDPDGTCISEIMSAPLISARPSDSLEQVVTRMRVDGVRRIPIVRDGRAIGMVTLDDLLVVLGRELAQLADAVAGEIQGAREAMGRP